MSDTPRTDAIIFRATFAREAVESDFARQLERELAEAREDAANQRRLADMALAHRDVIIAERDTLAEALRKCVLWAECMSMRCERDRDNISWSYLNDAREALATVKGGAV